MVSNSNFRGNWENGGWLAGFAVAPPTMFPPLGPRLLNPRFPTPLTNCPPGLVPIRGSCTHFPMIQKSEQSPMVRTAKSRKKSVFSLRCSWPTGSSACSRHAGDQDFDDWANFSEVRFVIHGGNSRSRQVCLWRTAFLNATIRLPLEFAARGLAFQPETLQRVFFADAT